MLTHAFCQTNLRRLPKSTPRKLNASSRSFSDFCDKVSVKSALIVFIRPNMSSTLSFHSLSHSSAGAWVAIEDYGGQLPAGENC